MDSTLLHLESDDGSCREAFYGPKRGCTPAYTFTQVRSFVLELYAEKRSLRRIAKEDFGGRVNHAAIQRVIDNVEPHSPEIRQAFGLAVLSTVIVIDGGSIPAGALVLKAEMCECGQAFISNSPNRRKCFICSPYKRGRGWHRSGS